MRLRYRNGVGILAAAGGLLIVGNAYGQADPQKPLTSDQFFKNVVVLKGIPVNQFMATMGFFSASLGYSCENCHDGNSWENYIADTPKKRTARAMVGMVQTINKNFFGSRQVVTCYSCHHGGDHPKITPDLTALYSPPSEEADDLIKPSTAGPSADQIFDAYAKAIGGEQKIAGLKSYIAKGSSVGYGLDVDKQPVEIYANASPAQRTTIVHGAAGESVDTFDGHAAWVSGPQIAGPNLKVPVLTLAGEDLEGARLDAEIFFPGRAKQTVPQWRAGTPLEIDDKDVQVVQGTSAGGVIATLYFDAESHLLVRSVRYTNSPVGRIPTRFDYSDYRDVDGVKMPFKWTVTWLDGRESFELTDVQPNVVIDAAKFAKPPAR